MIYFFDGVDSTGKSYIASKFHQKNLQSVLIRPSDFKVSKDESWLMVWIKIFVVCRTRYKGRIVICDRSPLSEIVYNPDLSDLERALLKKMIRPCDTVFIIKRSYSDYITISSKKSYVDIYDSLSEEEFYGIQNMFLRFLGNKNILVFPGLD